MAAPTSGQDVADSAEIVESAYRAVEAQLADGQRVLVVAPEYTPPPTRLARTIGEALGLPVVQRNLWNACHRDSGCDWQGYDVIVTWTALEIADGLADVRIVWGHRRAGDGWRTTSEVHVRAVRQAEGWTVTEIAGRAIS